MSGSICEGDSLIPNLFLYIRIQGSGFAMQVAQPRRHLQQLDDLPVELDLLSVQGPQHIIHGILGFQVNSPFSSFSISRRNAFRARWSLTAKLPLLQSSSSAIILVS